MSEIPESPPPDSARTGHLLAALAYIVEEGHVEADVLHEALRVTATDRRMDDGEWDAWCREQAERADQRVRAAVVGRGPTWVGGPQAPPDTTPER